MDEDDDGTVEAVEEFRVDINELPKTKYYATENSSQNIANYVSNHGLVNYSE